MTETALLKRTLLSLGRIARGRFWRNNTGQAWMGAATRISFARMVHVERGDVIIKGARPVKFGLPGSGDIIGLRSIEITPEMVGQTIAQFVSVETKTGRGRQTEQQVKFEAMVRSLGGLAFVARDAAEAERIVRGRE